MPNLSRLHQSHPLSLRRISQPMAALGGLADAGIEGVAGIEFMVEGLQFRFGLVEMPDVMLRRIFRAALIQELPHPMLQGQAVVSLLYNVILVEHVAKKVPVVEFYRDQAINVGRKLLEPLALVPL